MGEPQCWCRRCDEAAAAALPDTPENFFARFARTRMNLCPECGCKRCPRSTAHWLPCSGSNEPGQPGSDYGPEPAGKAPPT